MFLHFFFYKACVVRLYLCSKYWGSAENGDLEHAGLTGKSSPGYLDCCDPNIKPAALPSSLKVASVYLSAVWHHRMGI